MPGAGTHAIRDCSALEMKLEPGALDRRTALSVFDIPGPFPPLLLGLSLVLPAAGVAL